MSMTFSAFDLVVMGFSLGAGWFGAKLIFALIIVAVSKKPLQISSEEA